MTVEPVIAGAILAGMGGLQGWTLKSLVDLRVELTRLSGDLKVLLQKINDLDCQKGKICSTPDL
jgi:hypothetical protein